MAVNLNNDVEPNIPKDNTFTTLDVQGVLEGILTTFRGNKT